MSLQALSSSEAPLPNRGSAARPEGKPRHGGAALRSAAVITAFLIVSEPAAIAETGRSLSDAHGIVEVNTKAGTAGAVDIGFH